MISIRAVELMVKLLAYIAIVLVALWVILAIIPACIIAVLSYEGEQRNKIALAISAGPAIKLRDFIVYTEKLLA